MIHLGWGGRCTRRGGSFARLGSGAVTTDYVALDGCGSWRVRTGRLVCELGCILEQSFCGEMPSRCCL